LQANKARIKKNEIRNSDKSKKNEVHKQYKVGFLEVVEYPQWVSNIVVVPKKGEKVKVCMDFRDLNWASLKNDFYVTTYQYTCGQCCQKLYMFFYIRVFEVQPN